MIGKVVLLNWTLFSYILKWIGKWFVAALTAEFDREKYGLPKMCLKTYVVPKNQSMHPLFYYKFIQIIKYILEVKLTILQPFHTQAKVLVSLFSGQSATLTTKTDPPSKQLLVQLHLPWILWNLEGCGFSNKTFHERTQ